MRSVVLVVALVMALGCKGDPARPDVPDQPILDAYNPPWFHPKPGEIKNWDIQLAAPYNFGTARQLYVVELFDVVPSQQTLDYGDGMPITVPPGSQPTAIASLKAAGATVICHVGIGSIKLTDPDASKFPGYKANHQQIPNRPTAPEAASVIGWSTPTSTTDANERYLDIRAAGRAMIEKYILKRIELADTIGCQGVLGNGNDAAITQDSGFAISSTDNLALVPPLSKRAHELEIALAGRGGHGLPNLDEVKDDFDFIVAERCTELPDCDRTRVFINYQRAVLGLEYDIEADGTTPYNKIVICNEWMKDTVDGIIKKATLDSTLYETCP